MSIDSNYFSLLSKLPPYVFSVVNELKYSARRRGDDIIAVSYTHIRAHETG